MYFECKSHSFSGKVGVYPKNIYTFPSMSFIGEKIQAIKQEYHVIPVCPLKVLKFVLLALDLTLGQWNLRLSVTL